MISGLIEYVIGGDHVKAGCRPSAASRQATIHELPGLGMPRAAETWP